MNKTVLGLGPERLTATHGPIPKTTEEAFSVREVNSVYCEFKEQFVYRVGNVKVYLVRAEIANREEPVDLTRPTEYREQALFIATRLDRACRRLYNTGYTRVD